MITNTSEETDLSLPEHLLCKTISLKSVNRQQLLIYLCTYLLGFSHFCKAENKHFKQREFWPWGLCGLSKLIQQFNIHKKLYSIWWSLTQREFWTLVLTGSKLLQDSSSCTVGWRRALALLLFSWFIQWKWTFSHSKSKLLFVVL